MSRGTISHELLNNDPSYSSIAVATVTVGISDNDQEPCPAGPALTPIAAAQGSCGASPLAGQSVTLQGVVVGDFQGASRRTVFSSRTRPAPPT